MAERRMFSKAIIQSDIYLNMPQSTQNLYIHLSVEADDDGFIDSPRKTMRMIGAAEDDLTLLVAKQFLIPFESGVMVVRHWAIHNYIRPDRYKPTQYQFEKSALSKEKSGAYTLCLPNGSGLVYQAVDACHPNSYITEQNRTEDNIKESFLSPIESDDEETKGEKNKKVYADDSREMQLALLLSSEIKKNKPDWIMRGGIQSWCDTFRLILERDKRDFNDVISMIKFCQWDEFWRGNILSPDKLRKQYDTLCFKREEARKKLEK